MRYVIAGGAVLAGVILLGLAAHDTVIPAWQVLTGQKQPTPVNGQSGGK